MTEEERDEEEEANSQGPNPEEYEQLKEGMQCGKLFF